MKSIALKTLITTIIKTYRRPKLLQKAILSVLNQTYPHFQVCIYDNASGDDTSAVVSEIARKDPRVRYHCHPKNIGGIANFNYGMEQVTTPYFSLLSDDNTLLPNFFEDAINTLNRYPEAVLFAGQTILVNDKGHETGRSLNRWESGLIFPPDGLLNTVEKGIPTWESVLFRSEVLNSVGLLNSSFGGSADQDFIMRIARKHILCISKKQLALFLQHGTAWSDNRDLSEIISIRRKMLEQWYHDEELSDSTKKRIMKTLKGFVTKEMNHAIYKRWIIGDDRVMIGFAKDLAIHWAGFSLKPLTLIIAAKLTKHNRFLERFVLTSLHWYRQFRNR
jgi:glycosyltransferase involved in cell wall biosynthesis